MTPVDDEAMWAQLTQSAIGRLGGAVVDRCARATAESMIVRQMRRLTVAWSFSKPASRFRVVATLTLSAVATHVALMLPQRPPGTWWLILPALAGVFGAVVLALSFMVSASQESD